MPSSIRKTLSIAALLSSALAFSPAFAQDSTFKMGSVIPLTGAYGAYGAGMAESMKIAIEEIDEAGGVLGAPVELILEDDQGDPTAGLNAAKKLVDVDGVNIIVGTFASSVSLPILAYTVPAGIPVMTVSGAPQISDIGKESGLVFRMVSTEGKFAEGYAIHAANAGKKRAYVLAANNAAQLDAAASFKERFPKEGGEWLGETIFEPGQPSYQSELNAALDANPDVIMMAAYTPDAITMAKMLYQLEPDVSIVGPLYAFNANFIEGVGDEVAEGVLAVDAMSAEDSPAFKSLLPKYTEATGSEPTSNPYAIMAYDMVITAALAAEAAGSTDPAKFVPFMKQVANAPGEVVSSYEEGLKLLKEGKDIDYSGASSPIEFNEFGDQATMFMRGFILQDGALVTQENILPQDG